MLRLLILLLCKIKGHAVQIGTGTALSRTTKLVASSGEIVIGRNCTISEGAILSTYGGRIVIGNNVSINPYCVLYGHGGLHIGDDSRIAAGVTIIPANHVYADKDMLIREQGLTKKGIHIGKDVWIGTGARILDGVRIGDKAIIGAGAVVTKNIEAGVIAVGVPAKRIANR